MRISELIAQLQRIQAERGDLPVAVSYPDRDGYFEYRPADSASIKPLWPNYPWCADHLTNTLRGPPQPMLVINT